MNDKSEKCGVQFAVTKYEKGAEILVPSSILEDKFLARIIIDPNGHCLNVRRIDQAPEIWEYLERLPEPGKEVDLTRFHIADFDNQWPGELKEGWVHFRVKEIFYTIQPEVCFGNSINDQYVHGMEYELSEIGASEVFHYPSELAALAEMAQSYINNAIERRFKKLNPFPAFDKSMGKEPTPVPPSVYPVRLATVWDYTFPEPPGAYDDGEWGDASWELLGLLSDDMPVKETEQENKP